MAEYDLNMDWAMLEEQKAFLLELIAADENAAGGLTKYGQYGSGDHPLEGLVALIDSIQDQGEAMGYRVYSEEDAAEESET